jgi:hypothetical protein
VQAYLPDLEVGSSAKKKKYSHSNKNRGRTNRNYHRVMQTVLQGIKAAQEKGGFPAYVCNGDLVSRCLVIPVLAFVKGDAKSGDTLVSRFGGKNCKCRVPRLCFTGLKDLDDPMHDCLWVRMVDQQSLNQKIAQLTEPSPNESNKDRKSRLKSRKEYLEALNGMSAHHCDNAFFDVCFGHNPYSIMLATPSDMMHLFESGILKRVCQSFTASMSTSVQVDVDNLMEDIFRTQRTTLSNSENFLRTNFRGGATHLTMLSSHHWPGMAFAFLLMLLMKSGKEVCSSCFQEDDVDEVFYDWSSTPGLDLDNVYKPPSLYQTQTTAPILQHEEFWDDDDSGDTDQVGSGTRMVDGNDSESEDDYSMPANLTKRKKTNKGPIKMKCSLKQFVGLLESLLVFHAMYKCGPPMFGPTSFCQVMPMNSFLPYVS